MRIVVMVVVGSVALASTPREVDACSCGIDVPKVSPANEATGVPRNAIVIVRLDNVSATDVVLRDAASSTVVPVIGEVRRPIGTSFGATYVGTPTSLLAANTTYEVATKQGGVEVTTSFTTGDAIDDTPPAFTGIVAMAPETMTYPVVADDGTQCISSCINAAGGHISRIHVDYPTLPADAVHTVLQLYRRGEQIIDEVPVPSANAHLFGYSLCTTQSPVLQPGVEYCGRIVAYDVAGNRAGLDAEVCAVAAVCAPLAAESDDCRPSDECRTASPPEQDSGGCASTHAPAGFAALGLLAMRRRRRATRT